MTHVYPYAIVDAPNYGSRVPVDTTPGPAPVCRALKTHPMPQNAARKPISDVIRAAC